MFISAQTSHMTNWLAIISQLIDCLVQVGTFVFYLLSTIFVSFTETLDELTAMVVPLFEKVINKNVAIPEWLEHPCGCDQVKVSLFFLFFLFYLFFIISLQSLLFIYKICVYRIYRPLHSVGGGGVLVV